MVVRTVVSPARVNILGEHTDRWGGLALPFATSPLLRLIITPNGGELSGDPTVCALWEAAGGGPADIRIESGIPIGAGMSSSAALCTAVTLSVNSDMSGMELAKEAQKLEHSVLGTKCGLLDQIAITHGQIGSMMLVDFHSLEVELIPFPKSWRLRLIDTGVRRNLAETMYSKIQPDSEAMRFHVEQENSRVRLAIGADAVLLGRLLNESHASLRDYVRVSTPDIEREVSLVRSIPGVLGVRLMGGGFGGMLLAVVDSDDVLPEALCPTPSGPVCAEQ
mgnify:FL=1